MDKSISPDSPPSTPDSNDSVYIIDGKFNFYIVMVLLVSPELVYSIVAELILFYLLNISYLD